MKFANEKAEGISTNSVGPTMARTPETKAIDEAHTPVMHPIILEALSFFLQTSDKVPPTSDTIAEIRNSEEAVIPSSLYQK